MSVLNKTSIKQNDNKQCIKEMRFYFKGNHKMRQLVETHSKVS